MTENGPIDDRFDAVVKELDECRMALHLSDASFARDYLPIDDTTWCKCKAGKYHRSERGIAKLQQSLLNIRALVENAAQRVTDERPYFDFPNQKRVIEAIRRLIGRRTQNRLVVFLADTGAGKTTLIEQICCEFEAISLEADETWRTSYYACCSSIAEAAGATGPWRAKHNAQSAMLTALCRRPRVLVVDEGNYFGPEAVNCFKLVLNKSPTVVCIVGQPVLWDRLMSKRSTWCETRQLRRRANLVVRNDRITPAQTAKFFGEFGMNGSRDEVLRYVTEQANAFGMYDLIWRTVDVLRDDGQRGDLTLPRVEAALACAMDDMNPEPMATTATEDAT
jgi:DNA transposition AAA+ family ATPase